MSLAYAMTSTSHVFRDDSCHYNSSHYNSCHYNSRHYKSCHYKSLHYNSRRLFDMPSHEHMAITSIPLVFLPDSFFFHLPKPALISSALFMCWKESFYVPVFSGVFLCVFFMCLSFHVPVSSGYARRLLQATCFWCCVFKDELIWCGLRVWWGVWLLALRWEWRCVWQAQGARAED